MKFRIDNLQYCNWSRKIFEINREADLDAVHVTIVYHEDYDELLIEIQKWKKLFEENSDLIFLGKSFGDIEKAKKENKTAIFFGFQNCSPIEDDINLVEKVHQLGCKFMQLTYNNQSLLAFSISLKLLPKKIKSELFSNNFFHFLISIKCSSKSS